MISQFENTNEDVKKQERICSFYVSDYHFEMITLPYIENEIKQNHNVVILTENDLNETIKKVLKKGISITDSFFGSNILHNM